MNWYKESGLGIYTLLDSIKMQGEHGLSLHAMGFFELKEAKELEKNGFIDKVTKVDENGKKYYAYVINKQKFKQMGWRVWL